MSKCVGFIELTGDTLTKVTQLGTLQDYLLGVQEKQVQEKKEKATKKSVLEAFIQSAAISSVLVYLFGIGDRHTDNLMVTDEGHFVNIDFGYLEGQDVMNCPYARIPEDVINYKNNKELLFKWCKCVYLELRRYAMHFHSLLMFLHTAQDDSDAHLKRFEDFIRARFCVEDSEAVALEKLQNFLEASQSSTVNTTIRDSLHNGKKAAIEVFEAVKKKWAEYIGSGSTTDTQTETATKKKAPTGPNQRNPNPDGFVTSILFDGRSSQHRKSSSTNRQMSGAVVPSRPQRAQPQQRQINAQQRTLHQQIEDDYHAMDSTSSGICLPDDN